MGLVSSISSLISKIFTKPMRVVMVGLDAAGKTSILYNLKLGEVYQGIPTIGFNVETIKCGNLTFNVWDIGGGCKIRLLWRHYFQGSHAMVFVFDSQDRERSELAAEELHRLSREMDEDGLATILVFANKQDGENHMSMEEIKKILHPQDLKQKNWHIQPCSTQKAEGLYEGLEWVGNVLCPK